MSTARLTIDLDALTSNWRTLDSASAATVETGAVVKANGYGLGVERVGRALAAAGARRFFVAVAEEGAALRRALGPGPEINVFSGHMNGDTDLIAQAGLTPMLNSIDQLLRHVEALPGHAFGVQLDSGMNRLGMEPGEWDALRDIALAQNPTLIMSHLACADEPDHPMNAHQLEMFREMTQGLGVPCSLSATGGILLGPQYHCDVTRPGIGLYGGFPFQEATAVAHLDLPIIQTRDVGVGETVGYGNTWTAQRPSLIATVAAGYADGIHRVMGPNTMLYAGNVACPVVGRISMDLITVDISDLAEETPEYLSLLNEVQTVDVLADNAGTIGYEILTSLGGRYLRSYAE
ncbi:alanine racemase [Pseudooceanicola sediminis]|uniref:Alanine racemase n=1 Tax=Pseudooceanicola sediminis TaxID=2211117 RepID=A0A399J0S2_9RHOB|nr:alanine racemase [Pseudooceanicola sediminis]KAA2316138.1 alanine racemase [Puniceibacterium sp. HSS470]RII38247.1 alanine racemase [Pseudooceanicola sediminis]|tara:strand:- start:7081 stop:8124 length:1044 start_codon:yes stop_codon:yes gene_type:complete